MNKNNQPIIFYDGECGFCSHSVRVILRIDRSDHFLFAPLQGQTAQASLPEDYRKLDSLVVKDSDGMLKKKFSAIESIVAQLPQFPWPLVSAAMGLVPSVLGDLVYSLIAKNRFLFGRKDACELPSPTQRQRFLD
ncbi:thiol-disulfide oxidoreductase DCC family protein [Pseudobacteriovorax antillogorgiicola]|uniref:Predicted thiol-disulfide oxidoreductase YuxK, DCC family n=1 Tax=Pseudobacteriovorax antillogorgiicola TaxID=1513793 RepID=A0A1Y6B879_9BACT|nr:DCC1-like thiol-disulfide oxidoreductase family protein [Pseudobacteriovorax antillogorgiicola]TCS58517.1 putative DCC family thiol-disulfide oxidoreductase YuxK [Pseudobacteriovorax antillogorgiicola]SME98064.1 Predicted thiol-disulfide oxidoreductase YuxK, DCC family [Pseudobacteriovorax antillogorgiicola]